MSWNCLRAQLIDKLTQIFTTGPLYCSHDVCAKNGVCSGGRFVNVAEVNSFIGCQQNCDNVDTCQWFTFNQVHLDMTPGQLYGK